MARAELLPDDDVVTKLLPRVQPTFILRYAMTEFVAVAGFVIA